MNHHAGRANDDLVLIDQRWHLVALVEHVIDALACSWAGEDNATIHTT